MGKRVFLYRSLINYKFLLSPNKRSITLFELGRGGRVVEGARLESVYTGNCIEGSNPSLSARFFEAKFSHRHCEHSEAIQKPQYLWAFQSFCLLLDPYLTFSIFAIFAILPPKSPFLPSTFPIHANTPDEGTHVPKPFIYLGFRGLLFFAHAFFREQKPK
jgi:hypothetical protein